MATLTAPMAAQETIRPSAPNPPVSKRKFLDSNDLVTKKRRATNPQTANMPHRWTQTSSPAGSSYSQVYGQLLGKLDHKFEVKTMSVMPSTSISKHVDRALEHLGRFNPWDHTVLPGVVLLCAKSTASSKLVTISELVRRRIGESEQKWFQYNVLKEMVLEEPAPAPAPEGPSVVEDTFMAAEEGNEEAADDDYFETSRPTVHEQAVQPAKVRYTSHLSVLLSRVPLDELETEPYISMQTNEQVIEYLQKKKIGLVA